MKFVVEIFIFYLRVSVSATYLLVPFGGSYRGIQGRSLLQVVVVQTETLVVPAFRKSEREKCSVQVFLVFLNTFHVNTLENP